MEPMARACEHRLGRRVYRRGVSVAGQAVSCCPGLYSGARNGRAAFLVLPCVRALARAGCRSGRDKLRRQSSPNSGALPLGYHRFTLEANGQTASCFLLSAPVRAYEPPGNAKGCEWGVFLPLYALHSQRSWGAGDFSDLETLTDWVTKLGGGMVATLPLLAAFLDEPFEPGPYSPASRLFWNEFYLDVFHIPEFRDCPAAQSLVQSPQFLREVHELRTAPPLVDYRRQMVLKRRVLEELARLFFARPTQRMDALRKFCGDSPTRRGLCTLPGRGRAPPRSLAGLAGSTAGRRVARRRL